MFKVQKFNQNLIKKGNLPPLGTPNNRQFYITGAVGSIIGNLTQTGVKTVAKIWSKESRS